VRQWVLSLPFTLRSQLACDAQLTAAGLDLGIRGVFAGRRRAAAGQGISDGRGGAVTALQRFGAALTSNVHVHAIVRDGVFRPLSSVATGLAGARPDWLKARQRLRRFTRR
jgi:hypothetical protein